MEIVLIDIGVYQSYINENIRNLKLFGNYNITVITDFELKDNFKNVNVVLTNELSCINFDKKSKLEKGFWENTSKRLFYLYSYLERFKKKNVIHLENDYLIYFNKFPDMDNKVWITIDDGERCIPGIIFVPSAEHLKGLIENYDFSSNDMINMYMFYKNNPETVCCLPTMNTHPNFERFEMIFDAAAIGQYLGGIDPIHSNGAKPGYINPLFDIKFDSSLEIPEPNVSSKYLFYWKKNEDDLFIPTVKINELINIGGLHIHSKNLCNFQADFPIENRLIQKNSSFFITFASGSKDYHEAVDRLTKQAKNLNIFANVHGYHELPVSFTSKHSEFIKNNPKGYGYYLWKPYLILENLLSIEDNDILWYADAGCEINIQSKNKMLEIIHETNKNQIICNINCIEREFTKRDLLLFLDMDKPCYIDDLQYEATSICFKKCKKTLDFVKEWYELACMYNNINENFINKNYECFIEHRYDQSIFSLLMKKYYMYNRKILIGNAIELSRNRTGKSIFKENNFDWKQYIQNYPDLKHINTEYGALMHWNKYGKEEGRSFFKLN